MTGIRRELNDPAMMRVLLDAPTMQRWEILRRTQQPFSVAELAAESMATVEESQRSLDWLAKARLVLVNRATARRRQITYRAAMGRLFLVWDRSKPGDLAAKRAVDDYMRDSSRRIQDEAWRHVRTEGLEPKNVGGAISVVLRASCSRRASSRWPSCSKRGGAGLRLPRSSA